MKENPRELAYLILQSKYLEKMEYASKKEHKFKIYTEFFPESWFAIDLNTRIEIISYALKNNTNLEDSISYFNNKIKEQKTNI